MTDNDIIKALGCCLGKNAWGDPKCYECPYDGSNPNIGCRKHLLNNTIDLINRQKAEIERLTALEEKENQYCKNVCEPRFKAEIKDKAEKLRKVLPIVAELKAEAIKEFLEMAKSKAHFSEDFGEACVSCYDLDKVAEEMIGEQNDD